MLRSFVQLTSLGLILAGLSSAANSQQCEVSVVSPWQESTYVPQNSLISMNCTGERNQVPYWSIRLADREFFSQFDYLSSIRFLNGHCIYKINFETADTIGLLINSTESNNETVIQCVESDANSVGIISETTLIIILELNYFNLSIRDHRSQSVNISWSSFMFATYTLTVSSSYTKTLSLLMNESHHVFTAPEGAPPCEVYNFSVTATYVGATSTGAGCSVPSPVLSRMLPSLPDLNRLNTSLTYTLEKETTGEVFFRLSLPFYYSCEYYPVLNHSLEITKNNPESDVLVFTQTAEENNFTAVLWEDAVYTFKVLATNDIGTVYTDNFTIYTTDVQKVTVTVIPLESDDNSSYIYVVQCDFITGSDARGCLVVLVGNFNNKTLNLTRPKNASVVTATYPVSCFKKVVAFDIERNGSVGYLVIHGDIEKQLIKNECQSKSDVSEGSTLIVVASLLGLSLAFNMIFVIIITSNLCRKQHLLCGKQVAIASVNREVATVNIDHEDNSNGCESTPLDVLYEVITAADDNNTIIETKANEVYGVSTDGIETTPNEVYGIR